MIFLKYRTATLTTIELDVTDTVYNDDHQAFPLNEGTGWISFFNPETLEVYEQHITFTVPDVETVSDLSTLSAVTREFKRVVNQYYDGVDYIESTPPEELPLP